MAVKRLPIELWTYIFEHLDRQSLKSISVVDHHFRAVAGPLLFKAVSMQSSRAVQLRHFLKKTSYHKHVRTLEIYDQLAPTLHRDDIFAYPYAAFGYYTRYESPQRTYAQDLSWQSVAALLESLPTLHDLIWTCPQQFPPCLLWILHYDQRFAACRLHLRTFRLRSLGEKETTVDPHELELVQSPNLHSLWVYYHEEDVSNNEFRLPEAVSYATRSLAPNLRIVRLQQEITQMLSLSGVNTSVSHQTDRARCLESIIPSIECRYGRLEQLQFTGIGPPIHTSEVMGWSGCTDFNRLRALAIERHVEDDALTTLASYHFAGLITLSLDLAIEPGIMSVRENRQDDSTSGPAREFLCSLPPLRELRLTGEMDHGCLDDVLVHHGHTLRTLKLVTRGYSPHRLSLLPTEVSRIGHSCRALENLSLQMLRSRGNVDEVAAYASLGSIPSLQTLDLKLDASDYTALRNDEGIEPPEYDPGLPYAPVLAPAKKHFDDFDMEFGGFDDCGGELLDPRKGHVKDMFVNAALDRKLVEAIYAKLTKAKPSRALPFDQVEIRSLGGGDFGLSEFPDAIATVTKELHSRWIVQKDWSSPEQFTVTELDSDDSKSMPDDNAEQDLDPRLEPIFRRLWPASCDGRNWRHDWHGFPLASNDSTREVL